MFLQAIQFVNLKKYSMATRDHKFNPHINSTRSKNNEYLTKSYAFVFSGDVEQWIHSPYLKSRKAYNKDENGFTVRRTKGRAANL